MFDREHVLNFLCFTFVLVTSSNIRHILFCLLSFKAGDEEDDSSNIGAVVAGVLIPIILIIIVCVIIFIIWKR